MLSQPVEVAQAALEASMSTIARNIEKQYPDTNTTRES